jgi:hypothetical protein
MEEEQKKGYGKWIALAVIILIIILIVGWFFLLRGKENDPLKAVGSVLPFGLSGPDVPRDVDPGTLPVDRGTLPPQPSVGGDPEKEILFRQLSVKPVAGATTLLRNEQEYVRFIDQESGHAFEVDLTTGVASNLTNTTIPRVHEAIWLDGGDAVLFRYLESGEFIVRDNIKTSLGRIKLDTQTGTDTPLRGVGSIVFAPPLPDNISAVSASPDGRSFFYLLPTIDGTSGSVVSLTTMTTKEVLRNKFSEWLPSLFSNNSVLLTTKPSWNIPGFSYRYDFSDKTYARIVRGKSGLTTLPTSDGSRVLFGENLDTNPVLGVFSSDGLESHQGVVIYENIIPLTTIPEKCAWGNDKVRIICGSFIPPQNTQLPDSWYQGTISLVDTFWSADTSSGEVVFLADPITETGKQFDVVNPIISKKGTYFIFIDKNTGILWSMKVPSRLTPEIEQIEDEVVIPPEELKDTIGSLSSSTDQ